MRPRYQPCVQSCDSVENRQPLQTRSAQPRSGHTRSPSGATNGVAQTAASASRRRALGNASRALALGA